MNILARLMIRLNRIGLKFIHFDNPLLLVGAGASDSLCRQIAARGVTRLLLVTDAPLVKLGLIQPIVDTLNAQGITVDIFDEVLPDPTYQLVLTGVERLKSAPFDAVLVVGGGSAMDCAKAIVFSHANNCHPSKLVGLWLYAKPRRKGLPFFAIPTTAGTGSEATIAAVLSDTAAQTKVAIMDPKMLPSMVALDAKLTLSLPAAITAATGMDALTHAVEAYITTMALPETDDKARAAFTAIVKNLPDVYREGQDIQKREALLLASLLAGMAFTRVGLGYVHAIAHQLGGLYHLPHGYANAIVLPHVLQFSQHQCAERLAELAIAAEIDTPEMGVTERAQALIAHIQKMNAEMGIPNTVAPLRRQDFDGIIKRAFKEAHGTYGVPKYLSQQSARLLLEGMLATD